jgi:hypothetical protein
MRRFFLQVIGGAVVAAVLLGGIAFLVADRASQFDFLKGRTALILPEKEQRRLRESGVESRIYSFEANVTMTRKAALAELASLHYQNLTNVLNPRGPNGSVFYARGDVKGYVAAFKARKQFTGDVEAVAIMSDVRYHANPIRVEPKKGWITVVIGGRAQRSMFERFRNWVGI